MGGLYDIGGKVRVALAFGYRMFAECVQEGVYYEVVVHQMNDVIAIGKYMHIALFSKHHSR
jgi:hypothetical protein